MNQSGYDLTIQRIRVLEWRVRAWRTAAFVGLFAIAVPLMVLVLAWMQAACR